MLEGETLDYARDGSLVQASPYRANLLHGTVRRFGANEQVMEERQYKQGKPQGEWRSVDTAAPGTSSATGLYQRSEEHTSELQSLMRLSYAVFCLKTQTK